MPTQLHDGLIMRTIADGIDADREGLVSMYLDVFSQEPDVESIEWWVGDLISGKHPTVQPEHCIYVVDPGNADQVVSALILIPQEWRYEDQAFGVGRVELVGTRSQYRRQGLVRHLMNTAHQHSEQAGHLMQSITGIPHYYRQFGYSMSVDLGASLSLPFVSIPKLAEDKEAEYMLRPATRDDVPSLMRWSREYGERCALWVEYDEATWIFELEQRGRKTPQTKWIYIIQHSSGEAVGFVIMGFGDYEARANVLAWIVGSGSSLWATYYDVLRAIRSEAEAFYEQRTIDFPHMLFFDSGVDPALRIFVRKTPGGIARDLSYAWYIRVPDMSRFIQAIAPVLERRLVGSAMHAYTGTFAVHFYDTTALTMKFEDGKLISATQGTMLPEWDADVRFPYRSFHSVLLGHRGLDDLTRALPEVYANLKGQLLTQILFPTKQSWLCALA